MTLNRIDLHVHTTASDGVFRPAEVVALARRHRLDAIALTDHDTTAGLPEALAAAADSGLLVLPGVELAAVQPDGETIDLLGYGMDIADSALQTRLRELREARQNRAGRIVARLATLGLPIPLERVLALAGGGAVARPHIAQALLEAGYVGSRKEAFDRYIGNDGPAYVPHFQMPVEEAIALIHAAGGVAALAHPVRVRDYAARLGPWVDAGLDGLEVYYPDHTPVFTRDARGNARRYGLIMTGGSDFHGAGTDGAITLGSQRVPPACVEQILARAARYR